VFQQGAGSVRRAAADDGSFIELGFGLGSFQSGGGVLRRLGGRSLPALLEEPLKEIGSIGC